MAEVMADDDLLAIDSRQVARLLSVSEKTLQRMVKQGRFPSPVKMGSRCVRWSRAVVVRWLEEQSQNAGGA